MRKRNRIAAFDFVMAVLITSNAASSPVLRPPPDARAVRAANGMGLNPQVLAASGVTATQLEALLEFLADNGAQLEAAGQQADAIGTLMRQAAISVDEVRAAPDDAAAIAECTTTRAELASEEASLRQQAASLRDAAFELLTGIDSIFIHRCVDNSRRGVPFEFIVMDLDEAEWQQLRAALIAERRLEVMGDEADPLEPEQITVLGQVRSDASVALAQQNLTNNLGAIEALYVQWSGQTPP